MEILVANAVFRRRYRYSKKNFKLINTDYDVEYSKKRNKEERWQG
jgi:hypothetical protein